MNLTKLPKTQKEQIYQCILSEVTQSFKPNVKLIDKEDSKLMKFLSKILFFIPEFMTQYTTTIGGDIYIPKKWKSRYPLRRCSTIAHEYVHIKDRKRLGKVLFPLLYIMPQLFALLALLAIGGNLWWLLCLLFLLPLPSITRTIIEMRGIRMSMAVTYWWKDNNSSAIDFRELEERFINSNYYFMWPFRRWIRRWLKHEYRKIRMGELSSEEKEIKVVIDRFLDKME